MKISITRQFYDHNLEKFFFAKFEAKFERRIEIKAHYNLKSPSAFFDKATSDRGSVKLSIDFDLLHPCSMEELNADLIEFLNVDCKLESTEFSIDLSKAPIHYFGTDIEAPDNRPAM